MKFIRKIVQRLSSSPEDTYENDMQCIDKERKVLDNRLSEVVKVTLDGEDKWFLELVKEKPECALRVFEECKNEHSK